MVEKFISDTDIKKLLECSRCKKVPNGAPIYMCKTGHHECSICYEMFFKSNKVEKTDGSTDTESESGSSKQKHKCGICNEKITKIRNILAENLLLQLDLPRLDQRNNNKTDYYSLMKYNNNNNNNNSVQDVKNQNYVECCYNIYESPCQQYGPQAMPMIAYDPQGYNRYPLLCPPVPQYNYQMGSYLMTEPQPPPPSLEYVDPNVYYPETDNSGQYSWGNRGKYVIEKRSRLNFNTQNSNPSLAGESSKRPIRCPTHLCGRNIAVAALSSHFCFDHPDVPSLNVDFDVSCHLFIDPEVIPFDYGRCVAILLIPYKCESNSSASHTNISNGNKIKNSLPLVVMASKLDCSTVCQSSLGNINEDLQSEVLNHGDFQSEGNKKSCVIVIWLAGVDMSSLAFTTIQVCEKQTNTRSVIYTGPIISLRTSQVTNKVLEQGDCLVIHAGILNNIIGEKGGFDLHVMVH